MCARVRASVYTDCSWFFIVPEKPPVTQMTTTPVPVHTYGKSTDDRVVVISDRLEVRRHPTLRNLMAILEHLFFARACMCVYLCARVYTDISFGFVGFNSVFFCLTVFPWFDSAQNC